jgi:TonB family protein
MPTLRHLASLSVLIICIAVAVLPHPRLTPPQVISVTDAYLPYQVVFDGLFVLDISLDEHGKIIRTEALRDPGAMLSAADSSVRTWKFTPGRLGQTPVPSDMTAVFLYRPPNNGPALPVLPKDFKPVLPHSQEHATIDYVPAGIVSFVYPEYPLNSVAWGSVIVQITVNTSGQVEDTKVLHAMEPFTKYALDAVGKWKFKAATLKGEPVSSQVTVAYVFQTPYAANR